MCKTSFNEVITHENFDSGFLEASLMTTGNSANYVTSPLSVLVLLSALITSKGPSGETAKEICETIVGKNEVKSCENLDYPNIERMLDDIRTNVENSKGALWLSNAVFMQKGVHFYPGFIRGGFAKLRGDVSLPVFFNTSEAYQEINKWAYDATNHLIDGFLKSENELSKATKMVLLNAIAFTGKWAKSFMKEKTKLDAFKLMNGQTVQIPTMHMEGQMAYLDMVDFRVVAKDFIEDRFKFVIFLPTQRFDLKKIDDILVGNKFEWNSLENIVEQIDLSLPKFKIKHETNLKPVLSLLGVRRLFTQGLAQLTGISEDATLYAESAKQVASMGVDEYGVEAAAVTSISIMPMSMHRSIAFKVDSPFYCAIYDSNLKRPLFIARVVDPR